MIILNVEQDSPGHASSVDAPSGPRCPIGHDRPVCETEPPLAAHVEAATPSPATSPVSCHFRTEVSLAPLPVASVRRPGHTERTKAKEFQT